MAAINDTLTNLISSAKSVFQPRSENDIKSFEIYVFDNYLTDVEGGPELEQTPPIENDKRSKRRSMFDLPWKHHDDTYAVEFHRTNSKEWVFHAFWNNKTQFY